MEYESKRIRTIKEYMVKHQRNLTVIERLKKAIEKNYVLVKKAKSTIH